MRSDSHALGLGAVCLAASLAVLSAQPQEPLGQQPAAPASGWAQIDPAELARTEAKVEKGADAEALLWDVHILDGKDGAGFYTAYVYHVLIKIFTDHGRDERSTVVIPIGRNVSVGGISGRTIHVDGSTRDLKATDVFDRTLATIGGVSLRAKAFVLPGVEKGSIIEYKYAEIRRNALSNNLRLLFQQDIPVRRAVYHIRPISVPGVVSGMKAQWYHATPVAFTRDPEGLMMTSQSDLPAFHPEPYMPPAAELQPWLFVFYVSAGDANQTRDPALYWPQVGKALYTAFKAVLTKTSGDIVKAAAPVKAAGDLDEKIAAALAIVRTVQPVATAPPALRSKYKSDQTIEDALKRGVGDPGDIRNLFVALLVAAGVDVRPAVAANRSSLFMQPESANINFLQEFVLAIRSGDVTRFVDPTNRFSPNGGLRWYQEDEPILIGGDTDAGLSRVPLTSPYVTVKTRTGRVRLAGDGSIDADLSAEFSGHFSAASKEDEDGQPPADGGKGLGDSFKSTMPGADVSAVTIAGLDSPNAPYSYALHLKMPSYAQQTGTRLFVRPAIFQYGETPIFTAAGRTHPIYFPFPWTERDTVTVTLPPGFEFEDATAPAPVKFGSQASYEVTVTVSADHHEAVFKRSLAVGLAKQILFAPDEYPMVKKFFDAVSQGDNFALTVRKGGRAMNLRIAPAAVAAVLITVLGGAPRAASAPGWLKDAAALPEPAVDRDAAAVVLVDDVAVEISADGRLRTISRYAVRIRAADGRSAAAIAESYQVGAGKVREIKAWLIKPGGQVDEVSRDRIVDRALVTDAIYSDMRMQTVSAGRDADPGSVFGAEVTSEERTLLTSFDWSLQGKWPVAIARRSIKVPDGWAVKGLTFNHPEIDAAVDGRVSRWEARGLAGIRREPAMPPFGALAARLAATVLPPAEAKLPVLDSWTSVSRWLSSIQDPAVVVTDGIQAKSSELSAARPNALEKIKALGRSVQDGAYVSITMGIAQGGGYQPRPAADLLVKNWGDCKDKANFMRSLLAAAGIRSYMVGVYLGDREHVREQWPSPSQFNHAIVAIPVDATVDAPAVIRHPQLGPLLIVDVTDEQVPVGELSVDLQGSLGLIVSPADGALIRLPMTAPDRNLVERRWTAKLDAKGTLTGSVVESRLGDEAANMRRMVGTMSAAGFSDFEERQLSTSVRGARLDTFEPRSTANQFDVTLSFTAPSYAQSLQPTLLLVQPPAMGGDGPDLSNPTRHSPIQLDVWTLRETIELQLPSGFAVDELPAPAHLETTFGRFTATAKVQGDHVVLERSLIMPGGVVPADRVGEVRQFFDGIRTARMSPIVVKKG